MADDVKDIAVYTGSEWTSLSELAAEQVDVVLGSVGDPTLVTDESAAVGGESGDLALFTGGQKDIKDPVVSAVLDRGGNFRLFAGLEVPYLTKALLSGTGSSPDVDAAKLSFQIPGDPTKAKNQALLLRMDDGEYIPENDNSLVTRKWVETEFASVSTNLPIESVDGSVSLSSPEVNQYVVNVGAADRITVTTSDITFRDSLIFSEWKSKGESPSKITLDDQATINVGGKVFNVASNDSDLAEGDGGVYTYNRTGIYSIVSNGIHFNSNAAGGVKSVSWKMNTDGSFSAKTSTQSIQCSNYFGQSPNDSNGLTVTDVVSISVSNENKVEVSGTSVKVRDSIWCNTFLPYDGAGAQLTLGAIATWTIDSKLLQLASNTNGVAGGSGLYFYNRTDDLSFVSNGIRFNPNAAGGVTSSYWVMNTNGDFVAQTVNQEIECTNYRGQGANTGNGFTIDSSVKVTVGNETKLNISDSSISAWPDYTPSAVKDLATKEYTDGKIWVGTTNSYNNVNPKLPGTLYCITD